MSITHFILMEIISNSSLCFVVQSISVNMQTSCLVAACIYFDYKDQILFMFMSTQVWTAASCFYHSVVRGSTRDSLLCFKLLMNRMVISVDLPFFAVDLMSSFIEFKK